MSPDMSSTLTKNHSHLLFLEMLFTKPNMLKSPYHSLSLNIEINPYLPLIYQYKPSNGCPETKVLNASYSVFSVSNPELTGTGSNCKSDPSTTVLANRPPSLPQAANDFVRSSILAKLCLKV